jgi:hypothetical protein
MQSTRIDSENSEKGGTEAFLNLNSPITSEDGTLYEPSPKQKMPLLSLQRIMVIAPWILTVIFATLSAISFAQVQQLTYDTYETRFDTDFGTSLHHLCL